MSAVIISFEDAQRFHRKVNESALMDRVDSWETEGRARLERTYASLRVEAEALSRREALKRITSRKAADCEDDLGLVQALAAKYPNGLLGEPAANIEIFPGLLSER